MDVSRCEGFCDECWGIICQDRGSPISCIMCNDMIESMCTGFKASWFWDNLLSKPEYSPILAEVCKDFDIPRRDHSNTITFRTQRS